MKGCNQNGGPLSVDAQQIGTRYRVLTAEPTLAKLRSYLIIQRKFSKTSRPSYARRRV
jgi:hypothetical protein